MVVFYQKLCPAMLIAFTVEIVILLLIILYFNTKIKIANIYYQQELRKYNLRLKFMDRQNIFKSNFLTSILSLTIVFGLTFLFILFLYYKTNVAPRKWAILLLWIFLYYLICQTFFDPDLLFIESGNRNQVWNCVRYLKSFDYQFSFNKDINIETLDFKKDRFHKLLLKYIRHLDDLCDTKNKLIKNQITESFENDSIYDNFIKFLFSKQSQLIKLEFLWGKNINMKQTLIIGSEIKDFKTAIIEASISKYFN